MAVDVLNRNTVPAVRLPLPHENKRYARLVADWTVVSCGWRITVPEGSKTDGASIPRALWSVCGHPLTSPRVYAAIVHDYIYGGGGPLAMTRADADAVYRDLLVRLGWPKYKAYIEWAAIRACGGSHWTKRK